MDKLDTNKKDRTANVRTQKKKVSVRTKPKKRVPKETIIQPPPPPSIDELIAEARELGEYDLIKPLERMKKIEDRYAKHREEAFLSDD